MNLIGMGDAASATGAGRDMAEPRATLVPDPAPEPTPQPAPDLAEVAVAEPPKPAGLDLTVGAMAAAYGMEEPPVLSNVEPPAATGPGVPAMPAAPRLNPLYRFDPREWLLIQGHDLSAGKRWDMRPISAPDVPVEGKQQPARPATIGNILRDGYGRKVRSASGGFVKTRF